MAKLFLARHGQSTYNQEGIWTGLDDPDLSEQGRMEVAESAKILGKHAIDIVISSKLQRARSTAQIIIGQQSDPHIPSIELSNFNEKDYGIYTRKNKQQVRAEVGEGAFLKIRRSWDYQIEGGQSLEQVHGQVMTAHHGLVIPLLDAERNVLVVSHNNTLRAYIKELDNIPTTRASEIELGTAEVRIYDYHSPDFHLAESHRIGDVH